MLFALKCLRLRRNIIFECYQAKCNYCTFVAYKHNVHGSPYICLFVNDTTLTITCTQLMYTELKDSDNSI